MDVLVSNEISEVSDADKLLVTSYSGSKNGSKLF